MVVSHGSKAVEPRANPLRTKGGWPFDAGLTAARIGLGGLMIWSGWPIQGGVDYRGVTLQRWESLSDYTREEKQTKGLETQRTLLSPVITPPIEWNQLVPSWNVSTQAAISVEVRVWVKDRPGRWYHMGNWSSDTNRYPRSSVGGQREGEGTVETDTLVLKEAGRRYQVRVGWAAGDPMKDFKQLAVSLLDTRVSPPPLAPHRKAWGHNLTPPSRSQADYPEGIQSWCSPAASSMLLGWWARELRRPEVDAEVPVVAGGVFDPQWPGTGNWAFNAAYLGSRKGLRAMVCRLTDLQELELLIEHDIPVAASVSYAMLKGKPAPDAADGHLVVVVGFNPAGDVLVNDPGVNQSRVRRPFARRHFRDAWGRSRNTIYLVWPDDRPLPLNPYGHW